ncbi:MAG: response regulator [Spirochaetes bacterium]|jgi:signal transduction histidine kinase|nr:response regulator [Spirochaetota bacterium]
MNEQLNARILVIDDEEAIRDSFREILLPRSRDYANLHDASNSLFGSAQPEFPGTRPFDFKLDEAADGEAGLEKVREAASAGTPYAAIFVDMRMPGRDGLETVQQIRELDGRAEIIFITAYSDHSIEEVVDRAGANVGYHTKPFVPEEIRQLATKAVYEWNKTRNLENLITIISDLRATQSQLDPLLNNVLHQVAELVGSGSALIAFRGQDSQYRKHIGIGRLADEEVAEQYLSTLPEVSKGEVVQGVESIYFSLDKYGVVALFENSGTALNNDRVYMIRLFLEQAAQAIDNAELQEELIRTEKLSAVGQGINMVAHDLRSPLGNIISLVELVKMSSDEPGEIPRYLDLIKQSAENAATIVSDILDFTRNTEVEKQWMAASRLIERVVDDAARQETEGQVTIAARDSAGVEVLCDFSKMQRVLSNLVRNSAEALTNAGVADPVVSIGAEIREGATHFFVSDNGPGLPEEVRSRLFVPFVTQRKHSGNGLGLAMLLPKFWTPATLGR